MKRSWPHVTALAITVLLAGCSSLDKTPLHERQPIIGLGRYAADKILTSPDWPLKQPGMVILIAPPRIDATLPVSKALFEEALTRGLLSHDNAPQVLNWTPLEGSAALAPNQWLLEARLSLPFGPLDLSDRLLYPYQLLLSLRRDGDTSPSWQTVIDGAFDSRSLEHHPHR